MNPQRWPAEDVPADLNHAIWRGNGANVEDADAVINPETSCSVFRMRVTELERQAIAEGGDVYIVMFGHVIPFAASAHLDTALDLARTKL